MENRRAKMIAEIIKHLMDMDGEALKGEMAPPVEEMAAVAPEGDAGPMEVLAAEGTDPASEMQEEEMTDEELEELANLGG